MDWHPNVKSRDVTARRLGMYIHKGMQMTNQRPRKVGEVCCVVVFVVCLQGILDELKAKGLSVHVADYSAWGPALSKLLRRAKIVLNLHNYDARILETCRIMESLSYGALVQ